MSNNNKYIDGTRDIITDFNTDYPGSQVVNYKINGNDIGSIFTDATGNFTQTDYVSNFVYLANPLNELFASSVKLPFVISSIPPVISGNYVFYTHVDTITNTTLTNSFKVISSNNITTLPGVQVLCVGGGGTAGADGGYWGSGGGGAGTVQIGSMSITCNLDYEIRTGKSGDFSSITYTGSNTVVKSMHGGRGMDNGGTATTGGSGGGGSAQAPGTTAPSGTGPNEDLPGFTAYKKVGGYGWSNNNGAGGGGGGGGAGGAGANAPEFRGGNGGVGKIWDIDGKTYGSGGNGQGDRNSVRYDYSASIDGTGEGGDAEGLRGGSGIVIIAIPKSLVTIPTPYHLLVYTTASTYSTASNIPTTVVSTTSQNFVLPEKYFTWGYAKSYAHVLVVGGGGGGGGTNINDHQGGGGGGGGTVAIGYIELIKDRTYTITVGEGTDNSSERGNPSSISYNNTNIIQAVGGGRGAKRVVGTSGYYGGSGGSGGGTHGSPQAYGNNYGAAGTDTYDNFSMYRSPGATATTTTGTTDNIGGGGGGGAGVTNSGMETTYGSWYGINGSDGKKWYIDGNYYGGGGGGGGHKNQTQDPGWVGGLGGSGGIGGGGHGSRGGANGIYNTSTYGTYTSADAITDAANGPGTDGTGGGGGGGMDTYQTNGFNGGGGIVIIALIR